MSALCVKLERNSLYVPPPPQLSTCSMWTTRGNTIIYICILPSAHILPSISILPSTHILPNIVVYNIPPHTNSTYPQRKNREM